jgi:hypothetical protein
MPNGMDLSKSMSRPDSRANKVLAYLRTHPHATKADILRDVFGRTVVKEIEYGPNRGTKVTRGWGAYLFVLLQSHGYIRKIRKGNTVTYTAVSPPCKSDPYGDGMTPFFKEGTKVWPVYARSKNPEVDSVSSLTSATIWCAKPVKLTRAVTIEEPPVDVPADQKFSRFREMNARGKRYAIYLFSNPVPQKKHFVIGFVANAPI